MERSSKREKKEEEKEMNIWKEVIEELRKVQGSWVIALYNDKDESFALADRNGKGVIVDRNNKQSSQKEFFEEIENFTSVPYSISIEFWDTKTHDFRKPNYSSPLELLAFLRKENPSYR